MGKPDKNHRLVRQAFLYADGSMQDLWTLGETSRGGLTDANDINEAGQILGEIGSAAYLYTNHKMIALGSLAENGYCEARRVNRAGQVVGNAKSGDGHSHAFLFSEGKMSDLGTLGGWYSNAEDINDSGQIVGSASTANGRLHAFVYSAGTMHDLGIPDGDQNGVATGINASGQIVGTGSSITGWSKEPLGPVSVDSHAFIYIAGKWLDLNSRVNLSGSGLRFLYDAKAINNSGQIVGKAMAVDSYHAYLITPTAR
jgi:probable HAF family extracellular repeat protein